MWTKGTVTVLTKDGKPVVIHYWMKHYDGTSEFGINEGRISKLSLRQDGREVYNFDRGLDIEPQTMEAEMALKLLMDKYN
ncbi:MAG: hypothetical protein LUI10_01520 [Lachnospiraceae bacterium]|nr:hypothetical protein [Lachnospiraceae bacterium]